MGAAFFTIPAIVIHMILMPIHALKPFFMQEVLLPKLHLAHLILFFLATPVQVRGGEMASCEHKHALLSRRLLLSCLLLLFPVVFVD